jgi:hypothetical protein
VAALRTPPPAGAAQPPEEDLESMLRGMLKAMTEDPARGMEIARWAQRALRRLPAAARETEAALLLALGAAERLGTPIRFSSTDRPAALPSDAAWVLRSGAFSNWTPIGVRRYDDGIEFVGPDEAPSMRLNLPRTNPLYVQISWRVGGVASARTVSVTLGRTVPIPSDATEIRFRTLAGEELALDAVVAEQQHEATPVPNDRPETDDLLTRSCVLVELSDVQHFSSGFFVARDTVLSVWPGPPAREIGMKGNVYLQGKPHRARVIAEWERGEQVLLQLEEPVVDPVRLPRETRTTVPVESRWTSMDVSSATARPMHGTVLGTAPAVVVTKDGERLWELEVDGEAPAPRSALGAPVVIDGKIVGQLVTDGKGAYARSIGVLERFIYDALRPAEHDAMVFVSYAPKDPYGKGVEMDDPQVERVIKALREARVNPFLDIPSGGDSPRDAVVYAINGTEGGVVILTPMSHLDSKLARTELLALAYRRWAQPDFPLAALRFRRDKPLRDAPPSIAALHALDLDYHSDDELREFASSSFSFLNQPRDEATAVDVVRRRLESLFDSSWGELTGSSSAALVKDVLTAGVRADVPWSKVVTHMNLTEAREVVDIATMFSFPPQMHEPLWRAVTGSGAKRAFVLRAKRVDTARALIRRAWIGRTPPQSVVFGDHEWEERFVDLHGALQDVVGAIAEGVSCSVDEAKFLLEKVQAPFFLIFQRHLPPDWSSVEQLLQMMPSALLFFVIDYDMRTEIPATIVELPHPGAEAEEMFANALERLRLTLNSHPGLEAS